MQDVFYSQKKLKNMKLMKVESNEPCSVDVWLKLIKSKEILNQRNFYHYGIY